MRACVRDLSSVGAVAGGSRAVERALELDQIKIEKREAQKSLDQQLESKVTLELELLEIPTNWY